MKICVLSDTHGFLPAGALKYLEQSDEIWHAGDIGTPNVLEPWENQKIIRAVYGNIDDIKIRGKYPERLLWESGGLVFFMTHIGGRPGKYPAPLIPFFKEYRPSVFLCGHSHILKVQFDEKWNFLYMNPGACGKEGFHKIKTLLLFELIDKNLRNLKVVELEPRNV